MFFLQFIYSQFIIAQSIFDQCEIYLSELYTLNFIFSRLAILFVFHVVVIDN